MPPPRRASGSIAPAWAAALGEGVKPPDNPQAVRRHPADDLNAPAHVIPQVGAGQAVDLAVFLLGQRVFAGGRFAALDAPGQA